MIQVSNEAVWKVCGERLESEGSFLKCRRCPQHETDDQTRLCRLIARQTIEQSLRAVAEHPAGLPDGWAKGQGS